MKAWHLAFLRDVLHCSGIACPENRGPTKRHISTKTSRAALGRTIEVHRLEERLASGFATTGRASDHLHTDALPTGANNFGTLVHNCRILALLCCLALGFL